MDSRWRKILIGLPSQRQMTPEESANLAAYHKTKFKRVAAQGDELREAASKLVAKLDLIHADDRYKGIFTLAMIHGFAYEGPNYDIELATLRAALASEKSAPQCDECGGLGCFTCAPEDSK